VMKPYTPAFPRGLEAKVTDRSLSYNEKRMGQSLGLLESV